MVRPQLAALAALALTACDGNPFGFLPATVPNRTDTLALAALVGTPLTAPSGYAIDVRGPVRTDQSAEFDFAFDLLPDGSPVLIPLAGLGASQTPTGNPGFIPSTDAWDAIRRAPLDGYRTRDTLSVAVGDRLIVRSRLVCRAFGQPQYAKLEVLGVDAAARELRFRILTNINCGYRGLEPGLPSN